MELLHRETAKTIWRLAWPTVLHSFLQTFVGFVDTIMVGRLGPGAISAVGMSRQIIMVVMVIGLLWTPLFYDALKAYSPEDDPFALIIIIVLSYSLMNIIFGVIASSIGTIVRSRTGQLKKLLSAKE